MEPLGLQPIAISAWNEDQILAYIDRWSDLWHEYTLNESWARRLNPAIDPLLIKGWLLEDAHQLSPLLLSLKTWAAFAGDARGAKPADALDAYVRRMTTGIANARGALEQLAVQMTLTQNGIVERNLAGKYVSTFEDPTAPDEVQPAVATLAAPVEGLEDFAAELDALLGDDLVAELNTPKTNPFKAEEMDALLNEMQQGDKKGKESVTDQNVRRMLPELVRSNLLVYRPNGRISFSHPMLLGYLAGCGFAQRGGAAQLLPHPYWSGKTQALEYFAVSGNISEIVGPIFDAGEADPLKRALLIAANWPRNAAPNAAWRADVLRGLARYLTQEELSIAMRARLVTALATSGEATIGALFRRLLTLPATDARLLGALGCGLARYEKAVPELTNMLYAPDQFGGRAACMALVAIGSTAALEAVTSALLSAEDSVRQAAAEALANNPTEGYAVLRDGVKVTDLLVRRAVTFGLARVNQPWARELLDELHLNDDQWAVRSAAEQAISSLEDNDDLVPSPRPEIFTLPWLIKFAGEQGQGLAAGDGAWTTLKNVLRNGDSDQILNALDVIRLHPQRARDSIAPLYTLLRSGNPELREAAFETIWHLGSSGIDLPDPNQMLN
jgi:HEAT repeat protein